MPSLQDSCERPRRAARLVQTLGRVLWKPPWIVEASAGQPNVSATQSDHSGEKTRGEAAVNQGEAFRTQTFLESGCKPVRYELQVHHCYASEAPMKLATAILAASLEKGAGGAGSGDCLSQTAHGPDSLRNPEPDFYVVGAKSYGRGSDFLLTLGHQQIPDVLGLIESEIRDRTAAPSPAR